jgi:signal transduction histidine kinase
MTIRSKLVAGFVVLIVIFAASFFVNQRLSDEVRRNSAYLTNSELIIRNSNILHKFIIDMQSGYRGYLLTGQEAFLEPYHQAIREIPPLIRDLDALVTHPVQKQRLDSIMFLHRSWILYANSLIKTRRDTLPEASERYRQLFESQVKTFVGKKLNDRIRDLFPPFDEYEYKVRQERRLRLQKSLEATFNINLALTIFSILLAILSSFYITRLITRRIAKMVDIAEEISKGNFTTIKDDQRDELQRLSLSLNSMSQTLEKNFNELKKKNKDLDDFAYVVSHDLKAPLRGIDNITKWIEEDHHEELGPGLKKNIELIKGRTNRLENMINGLLDYARIGKVKRTPEQVDLKILLNELVEILVPSAAVVTIGEMPVIVTEKLLIEQVFSNLISNAVKYNDKPRTQITITCTPVRDHFEFRISDNGIGIQAEYFDKIFQIFQTLRERDAFESTGVGLAIVKRIIDDHKEVIKVESEPGKGTTFVFTWHKN